MDKIIAAAACMLLAGCASAMAPRLPSRPMSVPADVIAPCSPEGQGAQPCGAALNSTRISPSHRTERQVAVRRIVEAH